MYDRKYSLDNYLNFLKKEIPHNKRIGFTVFYNQLSKNQIESITSRSDVMIMTLERENKIEFGFSYYFSKKTGIYNSKQKKEYNFSQFYFEQNKISEYITNYYEFVNHFKKYSVFNYIYNNKYEANTLNAMFAKITDKFMKINKDIYDENKTNSYILSPNYSMIYNELKKIYL